MWMLDYFSVLESAPTWPGVIQEEIGANKTDNSLTTETERRNQLDLAKYSMPVLSSSAPELEGVWQEVKRRQREKDRAKQKTLAQARKIKSRIFNRHRLSLRTCQKLNIFNQTKLQ